MILPFGYLLKRKTKPKFLVRFIKNMSLEEMDLLIFNNLVTEKHVNNLMYESSFKIIRFNSFERNMCRLCIHFVEFQLLTALIQYENPN